MNLKSFIFSTLSMFYTIAAFGWGNVGHHIVGEIAEQNLNRSTLRKVHQILRGQSLAKAATWADEIRSDDSKSSEIAERWMKNIFDDYKKEGRKTAGIISYWHFTSVPDGQTYSSQNQPREGDIVWAIGKMVSVLKDKNANNRDKREALRLLAHYVGDIHQPLHVGNGLDRGGNNCYVNWMPSWGNKKINPEVYGSSNYVNLHSVYDSEIINFHHLGFSEYARFLNHPRVEYVAPNDYEREYWQELSNRKLKREHRYLIKKWADAEVEQWANESSALLSKVYLGPVIDESHPTQRNYCVYSSAEKIERKNVPSFGYNEIYEAKKIIDYRLYQAGVRLAALLEEIL
ncbi:MAG: S1/P1 nuclease [Halobacteriovoraceae bacterium]|nr:S1/P1 nuclease [Halobacteriovoraceae bacterium]MCB9094154.1 S1/P1 nuclease [Halobacteriovoraceae bacterium]